MSVGSNAFLVTKLFAMHIAMIVSSVHCPAFNLNGPPPTISEYGPYDCAEQMIEEVGTDETFTFAGKEPINVGDIFEPRVTNISHDWESGVCDDWDVEFFRTTIQLDDVLISTYTEQGLTT